MLELRIRTQYPDFAEELLLAAGALSVTFVDAADEPVLEPLPGETPLWSDTEVRALLDAPPAAEAAIALLRATLPDGAQLRTSTVGVDERDWVRACLEQIEPLRFGERLWICPTHRRVDAAGAVVVTLDPGLAFGTGAHPTTASCLRWLDGADLQGRTVLDFGCGSGILAIAALRLGAAHALATDIDPQALQATRANAELNGVAGRLTLADVSQPCAQPVDVVLANILARPLIALAPRLAACTARGGRIVLAGLLDAQADDVMQAYAPHFRLRCASGDGWTRVDGERRD